MGLANLWIQFAIIQGPRPQRPVDGSAEIIAVFHALHRLLAPRHPPHALSSLAALAPPSNPLARARGWFDAACQDHPRACIVSGIVTFLLSLPKGSTENRKNCHALNNKVAPIAENAVVLVIATFTACPNCQRTTAVSKRRLFIRGRVRRFTSAKDSCFLAVVRALSRANARLSWRANSPLWMRSSHRGGSVARAFRRLETKTIRRLHRFTQIKNN